MMHDGTSTVGAMDVEAGNSLAQSGPPASMGDTMTPDGGARQLHQVPPVMMTPTQMQQLRAQIMAYRYLSRNQPLPDQLRLAIEGKRAYGMQWYYTSIVDLNVLTIWSFIIDELYGNIFFNSQIITY